MLQKIETRESKVDVLMTGWDNRVYLLFERAIQAKDEGMKQILRRVQQVPRNVVRFLLKKYIAQCNKKYSMAFLEWRIYFSKSRMNNASFIQMSDEDVETLIQGRVEHFKEHFKTLHTEFHIRDETLENGSCSQIKNLKTYDFAKEPQPKSYLIDTFAEIGWPDPFPNAIPTGKYEEPNLSEAEKAKLKKSIHAFNQEVIDKDEYVHLSMQVEPARIIKEHKINLEKLRQKRELEQKTTISMFDQKKGKKAVGKRESQ